MMKLMRIKQRVSENGLGASTVFRTDRCEAKGKMVVMVPWSCRYPSPILYKGAVASTE